MHPIPNAQQQREEQLRREEDRREEKERQQLEAELRNFDAHRFYDALERWTSIPIPRPIPRTVHVTPFRQKVIMIQPLPISRWDLNEMRQLSNDCSRLVGLLRTIDQRGIEYPYIHVVYRGLMEKAIEKCLHLHAAREQYTQSSRGVWGQLGRLLNISLLDAAKKDIEKFKQRLEVLLMMTRHQEFLSDLIRLKRSVTYRTGALLDQGEVVSAQSRNQAPRQSGRVAPIPSPPSR